MLGGEDQRRAEREGEPQEDSREAGREGAADPEQRDPGPAEEDEEHGIEHVEGEGKDDLVQHGRVRKDGEERDEAREAEALRVEVEVVAK